MVSILLNAALTTDGQGYVRKLQLEFADSVDCVYLCPRMTRPEVAIKLRAFADKIEGHETGALPSHH